MSGRGRGCGARSCAARTRLVPTDLAPLTARGSRQGMVLREWGRGGRIVSGLIGRPYSWFFAGVSEITVQLTLDVKDSHGPWMTWVW